jgi:acyl carrier protein
VTHDQIRDLVVGELTRIAPEVDPATLQPDAPLRDQVDVDSMDFLNFVVALHDRLAVDIPESDYGQLSSVSAITAYLSARLIGGKVSS